MNFENWTEDELRLAKSRVIIRRPSEHTSLFKYIDLNNPTSWGHFEKTLSDSSLAGQTVNRLNDPFEAAPFFLDDLRPSLIDRIFGEFNFVEKLNKLPETKTDFLNVEKYRKIAKEHISKSINRSRVISFCERSDSPLLWSHYANGYKGACFHFLGRAFPDKGYPRTRMGFVDYNVHRPIFPLSLALKLTKGANQITRGNKFGMIKEELDRFCFFTKATDWSYENEIRIIHDIKKQPRIPFNPDGLISIILGPKMDSDSEKKLRKIVSQSQYPSLPIHRARLSSNTFSVEIDSNF